jgi:hypothetical protein
MEKSVCKLLMTAILVLSCLPSFSQLPMVGSEQILDKLRLNKGIEGMNDIEYTSIQGDPFIFKNFAVGSLTAINGEKFSVEVRYDMYANEMHIKNKDEIFAIIHPEKVKLIEADKYKFIYSQYVKSAGEENNGDSSYFIMDVDGKCKLLIRKNMRIQDAEPAKLYQEAKPAKFVAKSDLYYIKLDDKSAVKIKNEKELIAVLADKSNELKSFIKTNHLSVGKVEDLNKIVSYYNSL